MKASVTILAAFFALWCCAQPPAPPAGLTNRPTLPTAVPVQTNPPPVVLYTNRVTVSVAVPSNYPYVLVMRSSNLWDNYSIVGVFTNGATFTDITPMCRAWYVYWPNQPLAVQATNK
jgi:hypothetical protein